MKRVGFVYATREGHTALIAVHIAKTLGDAGIATEVVDLRAFSRAVRLNDYDAVFLAASVHVGEHEAEMVKFVRQHKAELEAMPSAFLSVTLSQAGVERAEATPNQRAAAAAGVAQVLERFQADTGWRPKYVKAVAGALLYTKYNFLKRLVLREISRRAGGSTDTSRDHIYTNWSSLEQFVLEFCFNHNLVQRPARTGRHPGADLSESRSPYQARLAG